MTGAIDTLEVLAAAGSKWNFLPFFQQTFALSLSKTGHCIGVDPYYLTHKAQEIGYHPEVILAGRRINDSMAGYVADEVVKLMTRRKMQVIDVVRELAGFHAKVDIYDTWIDIAEAEHEYQVAAHPQTPSQHLRRHHPRRGASRIPATRRRRDTCLRQGGACAV